MGLFLGGIEFAEDGEQLGLGHGGVGQDADVKILEEVGEGGITEQADDLSLKLILLGFGKFNGVAVDAFLNSDLEKARSLSRLDDKIDRLFVKVRQDIAKGLGEKSIDPEEGIVASLISKYLERVADHAVNIGEWVDYAKTGAHQNS